MTVSSWLGKPWLFYMKLPYRYLAHYRNGAWEKGRIDRRCDSSYLRIFSSLHYGQQAFEGLKSLPYKRWQYPIVPSRSKRQTFATDSRSFVYAQVPVDMFVDACKAVVKANEEYVPPYGTGATLYLRPFWLELGILLVCIQQMSISLPSLLCLSGTP